MKIWLETTDISLIKKGHKMGILHGVMTTPSKLTREAIEALLEAQPGPVAVDVMGDLVKEAHTLRKISDRIVIKIAVTEEAWESINFLSKEKIPVMATAIFLPTQALLAAMTGAAYIAPVFSRILKTGDHPLSQLEAMKKMIDYYELKTEITAAYPKSAEQIRLCGEAGINGISIREDVFKEITETYELTAGAVEQMVDGYCNFSSS